MPELLVPEIVDNDFREHYRELVRTSMLRAAEVASLEPLDRAGRSRLRIAAPAVWCLAVALLVCNAVAFGVESWPSGIADLGVLALTAVWFAVAAEREPQRAAAPAVEVEEQPVEEAPPPPPEGISGLEVVPLRMQRDTGGHITALIDDTLPAPAGWRMVSCRAGTLRGMHAHARADDLQIVVQGRAALGLHDLRPGSPTRGRSTLLELSGDEYCAVKIPAGVAHGVYAIADALVLVAVAALDGDEDELGCAWNDPGLGIEWPGPPLFLSERDRCAGPLSVLAEELAQALAVQR